MEARIGTIGPCQVFRNRYKSSTEAKVALLTALCRLRQRWNCILLRFFFFLLFFVFCVFGYYIAPQPHSWRCCNIGSEQCAASDLLCCRYCCCSCCPHIALAQPFILLTIFYVIPDTRFFECVDSYLGVPACTRLNFLALVAAAAAARAWIWLHSVSELNSKDATILKN